MQPGFFLGVSPNTNSVNVAQHIDLYQRGKGEREPGIEVGFIRVLILFLFLPLLLFVSNLLMADESSCYNYNSSFLLSFKISTNNKRRGCCVAKTSVIAFSFVIHCIAQVCFQSLHRAEGPLAFN